VLGALGILVLYGYGISIYGIFHLADYPLFLGIAAYLGLTSARSKWLRSLRVPVLSITICVSLMWGAVEKWAYPEWTYPLLQARPYLTVGVPPTDVMIIAGFIEFALGYYIMIGLTLVRPAILFVLLIFGSAIIDFGKVDAIGHLPVMVSLLAMLAHGPSELHHWFRDTSSRPLAEAWKASVAFGVSICLCFAVYYGLQSAEYGHSVHRGRLAGLSSLQLH
jgi:hypothetical protein